MWVPLCTVEEQKNFGAHIELCTLFPDLSVILYF